MVRWKHQSIEERGGTLLYFTFTLGSRLQFKNLRAMPLSKEDQLAVEKLRDLVKDELTDYYDTEYNLLRWLKGHNYDYEVIKPKLLNHLMLRKSDWSLDTLVDRPRDHPLHNHWKSGLTGEAVKTKNTVVNIEQTGANDYWGMLNSYPTNEILRARVYDLESMLRSVMQLEQKTGEQCSVIYVMDLTGIKMDRRLTTLISGGLAAISEFMSEHYVEMVHSFVLVNVPTFIHAIWSLARPLLPERTRNKVNIMGTNWKQEVLHLAEGTCFPSYWNTDGETLTFLAPIEKCVPFPVENYYTGSLSSEAETLSVPAGKTGHLDIAIKEGQKLSWNISASGNFTFVVYRVDDHISDEIQWRRVYPLFSKIPGPTIVPCADHCLCSKSGTYRLWFGNQHAWFHVLKLRYTIKIE